MSCSKLLSVFVFSLFSSLAFAQSVCTPPPQGLLYWWPGDNSGVDVKGGKNLRAVNGARYASGFVGEALYLDGQNDYFISPNISSHYNFTLEAWVKLSAKNTTNWRYSQGLVSQYVGGNGRYFIWEAGTNATSLSLYDGGWGGAAMNLRDGWHHVAVVHDRSSGRKHHYYDGRLVASNRTYSHSPITRAFRIGYSGDYNRFAKGLIDELSYYNRALSGADIEAIYNAGSAGKCNGPQDTQPPTYIARTINFDAASATISGEFVTDEAATLSMTVSDAEGNQTLAQASAATSSTAPFSASLTAYPDGNTLPNVIAVTHQAQDSAGNQNQPQTLLLQTGFSSSSAVEPSSGVNISITGTVGALNTGNDQGRPSVSYDADGAGDLSFTLTPEQSLALCGQRNNCVLAINGEEVATSVTVLPDGSIQYRAPMSDLSGEAVLVFDSNAGGAGVGSATEPASGNIISTQGDVVQTTYSSDGVVTVTAGEDGGQIVVAFTLSAEQDWLHCLALEGVCYILEDFTTAMPTTRTELGDGRVRYETVATFSPNQTRLYSLKVLDNEAPSIGELNISLPAIKGGATTSFEIAVSDNTRVITVSCRHTLPDGTVIEIPAIEDNGVWRWDFTPPEDAPSGPVSLELVVTDLGGNTLVVAPVDASGEVATVLLDNDAPVVSLPDLPITAPRYFEQMPVANRDECVQMTIFAQDATTEVTDLTLLIDLPNGQQAVVQTQSDASGTTFTGEYCVGLDAPSGQYDITIVASDSVGNVFSIQCESFEVNSPPVVDAGADIWLSPNSDGAFSGSFSDADPLDTHTIVWDMGDGNSVSGELAPAYSYAEPGIYTARLTVTDSFGGVGFDERVIYVVGSGTYGDVQGLGFWKQQYRPGKGGAKKLSDETLDYYLNLVRHISKVFDEQVALTSQADAKAVLDLKKASKYQRALQHTLTAWLNFVHGAIGYNDWVDSDGDGVVDMTYIEAMQAIEAILLDPNAVDADYNAAKTMAENIGG